MSKDSRGGGCASLIFMTMLIALLFNGAVMGIGSAEGTTFPWAVIGKSFFITWAVLLVFAGFAIANS